MFKKILLSFSVFSALIALSSISFAQMREANKPWEFSVGLTSWTGDHDDAGFDIGFILGIDYIIGVTENSMTFVGARGIWGSDGFDSRTFGGHIGIKFNLGEARGAQPFYIKAAAGAYNTELSNGGSSDETDFGGFIGIGYDFDFGAETTNLPAAFELGYFFMPEVTSIDNTGFYFSLGIRV